MASQPLPLPNLCSRCLTIIPLFDITSPVYMTSIQQNQWYDSTYGTLSTLHKLTPTSCELCNILYKAFVRRPGFDAATTQIKMSSHRLATYKKLCHYTVGFAACGTRVMFAPTRAMVTDMDGEHVKAFTGRVVGESLDVDLVRGWLARCEAHDMCRAEYAVDEFAFAFRVVDVQKGRLVSAPKGVRYVTLSYVWGGIKQVVLNTQTRRYLETEGSIGPEGLHRPLDGEYMQTYEALEREGRVIPQTTCDAIKLCQMLGERYLWTDALCIMQDEVMYDSGSGAWTNADKAAQIPSMNAIYGASVLTLIAACGADSNAGLPGVHGPVSTRRTQIVGTIGDQTYVALQEDPMTSFWASKWAQRAWTFQEFLLSKRHLIFLPDQTVFHCSVSAWPEDHALEYLGDDRSQPFSTAPSWTKSAKLHPLQLPNRGNWDESIWFPAIFINQYYSEWLKNFLKRHLTVQSDILVAFNGALSASARFLGAFHHGLPVRYLCETLLWSVGTSPMYWKVNTRKGLTQRRAGFPSWSWTGWMWDVAISEEFWIHYAGKNQSHWCRVGIWGAKKSANGANVELWQMTTPDVKGWERDELAIFPSSAFVVDDVFADAELPKYLQIVRNSPAPLNCLVIKSITSYIFVSAQPIRKTSSILQVFSRSDLDPETYIGSIDLSQTWQDKAHHGGLKLQIVVTGRFFRGANTQFPQQTDELNPSICCLVVERVGDMRYERITKFTEKVDMMKTLAWEEIVAVLQ